TRPGLARCLDALGNGGVLNRVHAQRLIAAAVIESDNASSPGFDAELAALGELGVRVAARGTSHEYLLGGNCSPDSNTDHSRPTGGWAVRSRPRPGRAQRRRNRRLSGRGAGVPPPG